MTSFDSGQVDFLLVARERYLVRGETDRASGGGLPPGDVLHAGAGPHPVVTRVGGGTSPGVAPGPKGPSHSDSDSPRVAREAAEVAAAHWPQCESESLGHRCGQFAEHAGLHSESLETFTFGWTDPNDTRPARAGDPGRRRRWGLPA